MSYCAIEKELVNTDAVIHLAAVTRTNNHRLYYRVNTEGTKTLLDLATRNGIRWFLFMSTRAPGKKGGACCHSKQQAESLVIESGLDWTIVRPAEIHGFSSDEAISKLVSSAHKLPVIPVIGNGRYEIAPGFCGRCHSGFD